MSTNLQAVRGTQSLYGLQADRFNRVVRVFDEVRQRFRFRRVQVPVLEFTEVFARSIGETTDIVSKEMYTFPDRNGDFLTLRPEFTAGVVRAFLTEGWQQHSPFKVGTWGPAFRYERPQRGRLRQFHQLDVEVLGASEPGADVEVIALATRLLERLEIEKFCKLEINTLGDTASRDKWRAALLSHFERYQRDLSETSRTRLKSNPLRILDSKEDQDRAIAETAPTIRRFLTRDAEHFFENVKEGLCASAIPFEHNEKLVRGLDYYRHTTFEFTTERLGAQGTLIGGGRYDGLVEAMGGPPTPAVGWAGGIERIAMLIPNRPGRPHIMAVVPENDAAEPFAQMIAFELRRRNYTVDYLYRGSAKKRLERYQRRGATTAIFIDAPVQEPDILATLNIKQFRILSKNLEQKIKDGLSALFDVLQSYEVRPEGRVGGRTVDFVLREKAKR